MEVVQWLSMVERKKAETLSIEKNFQHPGLVLSDSELNGRIEILIKDVEELLQQGRFPNGLLLNDHESRSLTFPMTTVVGKMFEENVETLLGWLRFPRTFLIGVYGMGGVGKTTLLKHIHNHLLAGPDIAGRVCWVTVSQDCSLFKLQHEIARGIGVTRFDEKDEDKRAALLHNMLGKMGRVVLVFDDVWDPFMVDKVGIPLGETNCKIIVSTRSVEVCQRMGCKEFTLHVRTLSKSEAWKLFVDWLQNYEALTPEVKQIAPFVAEECSGLPLAIITIAVSMRGVFSVSEWQNALDELKNPNRGQYDMENDVFPKLKFSYDRLKDKALQDCFLSCVLYPEDHLIREKELINLWAAEGLLDEIQSSRKRLNKGHTILNKLVNSCLLEYFGQMKLVKIHDLIRDMGIIITRNCPRYMAKPRLLLKEVPKEEHWIEELIKVSLILNEIEEIPDEMSPRCPKLEVLMLYGNPLKGIPDSFFVHMNSLKVLDLSGTNIQNLPISVSHLENLRALLLRHCRQLMYVPSLAMLTKLRVLDLKHASKIKEAPRGMERLKCLEKLTDFKCNLSDLTYFNRLIRAWQFGKLTCYQLYLCGAISYPSLGIYHYDEYDPYADEEFELDNADKKVVILGGELGWENPTLLPPTTESLEIRDCCIQGGSLQGVLPLLSGPTQLKELMIEKCTGLESLILAMQHDSSIPPQLEALECLKLCDLPHLEKLITQVSVGETESMPSPTLLQPAVSFSLLKRLTIYRCHKVKVVFQLKLLQHQPLLPNLESLDVSQCDDLEEIFEFGSNHSVSPHWQDDVSANVCGTSTPVLTFPNLRVLKLVSLPKLGCVYRGVLICTSLEVEGFVLIYGCPKLQLLSLSEPLICDASPSTLHSIPTYTENANWWKPLCQDYPHDAGILSDLVNHFRQCQQMQQT